MSISIVTCTWNSKPYIDECIKSVQMQTYTEYEHIFVDGGSTDGTLETIRSLRGNIKIIENVRGGISHAMNVGAKAAEGHIIAHLHGDDIYCSDKSLEIAASHLLKSEAAWLYGRCMDIINGKLYENNFTSKRYSYDALLRRNIIPHPSTFYKLQTFREIGGFSEQYKGAMDYDLWLRLGKIGDPVQVADYLAAFRSHVDSYSTKNRFACHNEALKIRLKHAPRGAVSWGEHLVRHVIRSISMMNETPQWASRE